MKPLLLLIDGYSLAFRSYYAFANRSEGGLRTSTGIPTSVCYGFLKCLFEILAKEQPQALAIAFDDKSMPTFRHSADVSYKANRSETPAEFIPDVLNLQQILARLDLEVLYQPGYEADDVIGTLALQSSNLGYRVKILTGDRDFFQLIDDQQEISVLHLGQKDKIQELFSHQVFTRLGISPRQVVDYKALCGDASDNIPGVRGIGEKTAVKLLTEYGSLEKILSALPDMKGAIKNKLQSGIESAKHSQFMAQIALDVPVEFTPERFQLKGFDRSRVLPLLEELELKDFIKKLDEMQRQLGGTSLPTIAETGNQDDLWFDFSPELSPSSSSTKIELPVQIIDTPEQLEALCQILVSPENSENIVAWDTETKSLNPHDRPVVGIGCCWGENDIAYIPIGHTQGQNLPENLVVTKLKPILENPDCRKVLQNAKFDRLMFRSMGIELKGVVFDTMLASYVLDPEASHSLDSLAQNLLNLSVTTYKELLGKLPSIAEVSIPLTAHYCGMDVYVTRQIMPPLKEKLEAIPELYQLFTQVELPLELVLAEMEWQGIKIDCLYLEALSQELAQDLESIADRAYSTAGKAFNLNSPKQLSEVLVELLGEAFTKKSRKSNTGYSTDMRVLENITHLHPLIPIILENRTLAKLKSTYVDALPSLVHPHTQRVHTDFNQTVTATGRLSSSNPNLQNIPIRTAFSRRIRQAFIPETDWFMLAVDYSQIELRILAHFSGEPELVRAYNQNLDVHTVTAQILLEKTAVTKEERRLAKIINYGVIYGMGAQKFSRETGVSLSQAKQFIQSFNQRYSRVFDYLRSIEELAETQGYVTTILGRRRYFREINQMAGQYKASLQRSAINAPIQGTSADIMKIAMIHIHQLLKHYRSRLLLQVHDELVLEIYPPEAEELEPQIKQMMESAITLSVPLVVEMHRGHNWMDAK